MSVSLERKKILVVDDEPDVGELIKVMLRDANVEVAHSFNEAQALLRVFEYDILILDIMGVDGFALLNQHWSRSLCVVITAHALMPQTLKRAIDENAVLYLPKDELANLPDYLLEVLSAQRKRSLWGWLMSKVNFGKYFDKEGMQSVEESVVKKESPPPSDDPPS